MTSSALDVTGLEKSRLVQEKCTKLQQQYGDCLPEGTVNDLPEMMGLSLQQNDLTALTELWDNWAESKQRKFGERYGHIGHLITIEPDEDLLRAMIRFWDPYYRCFTFHQVDMTPTIEEYTVLLNLKSKEPNRIYQPQSGFKKKLAKMLKVPMKKLDTYIQKKGDSEGIQRNFLFEFIKANRDDETTFRAIALVIYGLVIFPHTRGYIGGGVIDLVEQIEHGINPVPAILAETFRSLNACRREGQGRFKGCIQLLYVWAKCHFPSRQSYFRPIQSYEDQRIPLQEFKAGVWEAGRSKEEWIDRLRELTSSDVEWKPWWMTHDPIIYKCGKFAWVPLLGLWGAISYAPALVRRQMGSEQFIPFTYELNDLEFDYKDKGVEIRKKGIVEAWKDVHKVEAGWFTVKAVPEYSDWHGQRGKGFRQPKVQGPNLRMKIPDDARDIQTEIEYRHERAHQNIQAENAALLEEVARLTKENDHWKGEAERTSKRMKQELLDKSSLAEENARQKNTIRVLRGKIQEMISIQTENRKLQTQIQSLEQQFQTEMEMRQAETSEREGLRKQCQDLNNAYEESVEQTQSLVMACRSAAEGARELADVVNDFRQLIIPGDEEREKLIQFLNHLYRQLNHVGKFH